MFSGKSVGSSYQCDAEELFDPRHTLRGSLRPISLLTLPLLALLDSNFPENPLWA